MATHLLLREGSRDRLTYFISGINENMDFTFNQVVGVLVVIMN